jgi:hypothetical protein
MTKQAYDMIGSLANQCAAIGSINTGNVARIWASDLRKYLCAQGITAPSTGEPYPPDPRPMFTAIHAAYRYFVDKGDQQTANNIARTYTNDKGEYVYDK